MMQHEYQDYPYRHWILGGHIGFVVFLLIQIIFNYYMCVTTRNKGNNYDQVVRELAVATDFDFPETELALENFRRDYEDLLLIRMKRRQTQPAQDREGKRTQPQLKSHNNDIS